MFVRKINLNKLKTFGTCTITYVCTYPLGDDNALKSHGDFAIVCFMEGQGKTMEVVYVLCVGTAPFGNIKRPLGYVQYCSVRQILLSEKA
jgi:hypothetical protein